jgi:hypothetical protein
MDPPLIAESIDVSRQGGSIALDKNISKEGTHSQAIGRLAADETQIKHR